MRKATGPAGFITKFFVLNLVIIFFVSLLFISSVEAQSTRQLSAAKRARIASDIEGQRKTGGPLQSKRSFLTASPTAPNANPIIFAYNFELDRLISFNAMTPETVLTDVELTGLDLDNGEYLEFIDFRANTSELFGVATTSPNSNNARVVKIDITTGAVTTVGSPFAVLAGLFRGGDFNPVVDLIREVADDRGNRRLSPVTGSLVGTDSNLAYAAGDVNSAATANVVHVAYTNNTAGATQTTLYGIDSGTDVLVTIGSVNGSPTSPNTGQLFTVGPLNENVGSFGGFDIQQGTNLGFAAFRISGISYLYSVNLSTGAATLIGEIAPDIAPVIDGLAIAYSATAASADLAVTKTNGTTTSASGGTTTYTIVVTNNGADPVANAVVSDPLPTGITSATWTCTGAGGGVCPSSGNGGINASVSIPAGGSLTFTMVANISASATGELTNTVTVILPAGVTDPVPGNNSATDTDTLTSAGPTLVTVGGRVTDANGRGLPNMVVLLTDAQTNRKTAVTSSFGYYVFEGVLTGQTYTVSVDSSRRYKFPSSQSVQVGSSLDNVDFVADPLPE